MSDDPTTLTTAPAEDDAGKVRYELWQQQYPWCRWRVYPAAFTERQIRAFDEATARGDYDRMIQILTDAGWKVWRGDPPPWPAGSVEGSWDAFNAL